MVGDDRETALTEKSHDAIDQQLINSKSQQAQFTSALLQKT